MIQSSVRHSARNLQPRSDLDLARAIRLALEWNVPSAEEQIQSSVCEGVVTLEGTVHYPRERDDAESTARDLAGVREVRNRILVQPSRLEAEAVHLVIEEALNRHAAHAAKHIDVHVVDETVVLSGSVPSYAELEAVLGAASSAPGVARIANELCVRA